MERLAERQAFFGDTVYDALDALILQVAKGKDVLDDLEDALARAALQALLLGQGPLAGCLERLVTAVFWHGHQPVCAG